MKKLSSLGLAVTTLVLSAAPVLAADTTINLKPANLTMANLTFPGIITGAIRLVLVVAAVVFFFMLVIGGVRWILSGGEKTSVESARNQITNALIGLVIVFAAWAIAALVSTLFGYNIFTLNITPFTP